MEAIAFEIGHFHTFLTSVTLTLTLTLDWVIQHTVVYHSSTATHTSNFVQIGKTLPRLTYGHWDGLYQVDTEQST